MIESTTRLESSWTSRSRWNGRRGYCEGAVFARRLDEPIILPVRARFERVGSNEVQSWNTRSSQRKVIKEPQLTVVQLESRETAEPQRSGRVCQRSRPQIWMRARVPVQATNAKVPVCRFTLRVRVSISARARRGVAWATYNTVGTTMSPGMPHERPGLLVGLVPGARVVSGGPQGPSLLEGKGRGRLIRVWPMAGRACHAMMPTPLK